MAVARAVRSSALSQPSRARAVKRDALQHTATVSACLATELHTCAATARFPRALTLLSLTTARSAAVRRRRPTLRSTATTTGIAAEDDTWRTIVVTGLTAKFGIAVGHTDVGRAAAKHAVARSATARRAAEGHVVTGRAPRRAAPSGAA